MKREVEFVYDFKAFGQAIKKARRAAGYSRKKLGHELNLAPRYLVSIENEGQHPSLQVLYELCTFFDISVDQFFFFDCAILLDVTDFGGVLPHTVQHKADMLTVQLHKLCLYSSAEQSSPAMRIVFFRVHTVSSMRSTISSSLSPSNFISCVRMS